MALLPTAYSPFLVEAIVRLGARLPFEQVASEMLLLFGVVLIAIALRRPPLDAAHAALSGPGLLKLSAKT